MNKHWIVISTVAAWAVGIAVIAPYSADAAAGFGVIAAMIGIFPLSMYLSNW